MTILNTFAGLLLAEFVPVWQFIVVGVVLVGFLAYCIVSTVKYYKTHDLPCKKQEQAVEAQEEPVATVAQEEAVEETAAQTAEPEQPVAETAAEQAAAQEEAVEVTEELVEEATEEPVQEVVEEVVEEAIEEPVAETVEEVAEEQPATETEEADGEESESEDDGEESGEMVVQGKVVVVRYSKSFMAKLCGASEETKTYYQRITDRFLSYRKVNSRVSWAYTAFNRGRTALAKMVIRGKTLRLYLALDADEVADKYYATDVSDKKKYAATPCYIKVKSERGLKFALELVDAVCIKFEIPFQKEVTVTSETKFENEPMDRLINKGLIKIKVIDGEITPDATLVTEAFSMRK